MGLESGARRHEGQEVGLGARLWAKLTIAYINHSRAGFALFGTKTVETYRSIKEPSPGSSSRSTSKGSGLNEEKSELEARVNAEAVAQSGLDGDWSRDSAALPVKSEDKFVKL